MSIRWCGTARAMADPGRGRAVPTFESTGREAYNFGVVRTRFPEVPAMPRFLTALPVYNEAAHVLAVIAEVRKVTDDVLVVDDGSTDGTSALLAEAFPGAERGGDGARVVRHATNRGYGAALATAFAETLAGPWDGLVTIDCDGQHQPRLIPEFVAAAAGCDIVSGSRYLKRFPGDSEPPAARRRVNTEITAEINRRLGLSITDAFCGFKAYTRRALERLRITEPGYAMPLEVWVQAAAAGLSIVELPVPLLYLDLARSFGGALDDAATRLAYYRRVLEGAEAAVAASAANGVDVAS
jgi:glycosyltransferase involved in cell wall biosynthesis